MKKAIIIGASGFIGTYLLQDLLGNADYEQVTVVVRRKLDIVHPKLNVLIGDYHTLPALKQELVGDELFLTIGTTKAHTPDQQEYYQIDHDYPVLAAKLAKENGATSVLMVTAVGANPDSGVFYIRTKGEAERDIIALDFAHTHIFRPSMLMGSRKEKRSLEKFLINVFAVINPLFMGKALKKYRGIDGKDVACGMVKAAKQSSGKVNIYEWQEMQDLL